MDILVDFDQAMAREASTRQRKVEHFLSSRRAIHTTVDAEIAEVTNNGRYDG